MRTINKNFVTAILLSLFLCAGGFVSVSSARTVLSVDGSGWKAWMDTQAPWQNDKLYLPSEVNLSAMPVNAPTGGWQSMYTGKGIDCSIPACVEELFGKGVNTFTYHGVSWFFRTVNVPSEWKGKRVMMRVEKARLRMEIYLNEKLTGYDLVSETPYSTDITNALNFGATNTLAIRITNPGGQRGWEDFPSFKWGTYPLTAGHDYAGIDGPLELVCVDSLYIDNVYVKNLLPAGAKKIQVIGSLVNTTLVKKQVSYTMTIADHTTGNVLVTQSGTDSINARTSQPVSATMTVGNAALWDIDNPKLYDCKVAVSAPLCSDETSATFGFRTLEVKQGAGQENFYFNGKRIRLRSSIDWGYYALTGFYATPEMARRSVMAAKDIGHNGINFHRRIGEPRVLQWADTLGLYLYEEPGGFSSYAAGSFAEKIIEEKCRRMAIRDRNHPSLLMYNLMNEENSWNAYRTGIMNMMAGLDGTRMISNSSGGNGGGPSGPVYHMRPYAQSISSDFQDDHTVACGFPRFSDDFFASHKITSNKLFLYGEVGCYGGPSNWYLVGEMQKNLPNGQLGTDLNIFKPLHDKVLQFFIDCNVAATGSRTIATPADVSIQAGRGLMYIDGRFGQTILTNNSQDGYVINGWTSGPYAAPNPSSNWDASILDEGRNLKGPASDFSYWIRPLQIAINRANGKYFVPGDVARFKVTLVNEGRLSAGDYTLQIKVKDGNGAYTSFVQEKVIAVAGGETFAQECINPLSVAIGATWKGGYITVEGKLLSGTTEVANGSEQILLKNRPSYKNQISTLTGAVYSWPAAKTAIVNTGNPTADYTAGLRNLDYIVAGSLTRSDTTLLRSMLQRVHDDGTRLVVKFDKGASDALYSTGMLSQAVTEWGGTQIGKWWGKGWSYIDYFIGNQALPGKMTIGTNSWEVPGDPVGFYPFKSTYRQGAYGAFFASHEQLLVTIGSIRHGLGTIILDATYPVDSNHAFNDLIFYNMISMPLDGTIGTVQDGLHGTMNNTQKPMISFTSGKVSVTVPDGNQPFELMLFDSRGKKIASFTGKGTGKWGLVSMNTGVYVAVVKSAGHNYANKFICLASSGAIAGPALRTID